jgi:ketosteroid isomerase-like protein
VKKSICCIALAFAVVLAGPLPPRASAASGDEVQIDALYQKFAAAFRRKDVDGIMALYLPGKTLFVFDVSPPREHVGWNDYRDDWRQLFASMKGAEPGFTISELSVVVDGDVAYTHSIQHVTIAASKSAPASKLVVRVTDVLRKIAGKWLVVQEHVSVPVDLNTGRADLTSRP